MRILIVEDNLTPRELLRSLLDRQGLTRTPAPTGLRDCTDWSWAAMIWRSWTGCFPEWTAWRFCGSTGAGAAIVP